MRQMIINCVWFRIPFIYILQKDLSQETLYQQYKIVKQETNTSHVMEYGNKVTLTHWS